MGRRTELTFSERVSADSQQAHKKMLNITNHREIQIETTIKYSQLSESLSSKRTKITNVDKDMEEGEPLYIIGGNINCFSQCGKQYGGLSNQR